MMKENIPLKKYTSFKIGGPAKYFFGVKNRLDLIKAIETAKKLKLDFFILGGGGNVLVADEGYSGVVIKVQNQDLRFTIHDSRFKIYCESGVSLAKLLNESVKLGLTGMEWAVGVPGTVAGAIRGNAGAFGQTMAQIVKKVEVYNLKDSKFKTYDLRKCRFKYRDSVFKRNKNLIIFSAELEMKKGDKQEIKERIKQNLQWRKEHQPISFPSAGSIFKNTEKHSAGWLIEQVGLKGKKIGDAQISKKHANFIINLGDAKAKDVLALINLAKKKVKEKFNIKLEEEIVILNYPH